MCLHPISIKTKDSYGLDSIQSVPCGKCLECLKDRQNSWKIRLMEEARDHKYVYFFTLTYNDDSVPFSYDDEGNKLLHFRKSDLQLWLKRHRIAYERLFKREIDFKYFITSEYGPNTGRPHYHGIIFTDISSTFITSMFSEWNVLYGFTNFSLVGNDPKKKSRSSMSAIGNYVAKYCLKPSQLSTPKERELNELIQIGILPPPFRIMSHGLGESYIKRMKRFHVPTKIRSPSERVSTIVDRSFYYDGVFRFKLPRYYRDRLYRKKFPFETKIWNPKKKIYEVKIVKRYASKNMLSRQMQIEIRDRLLAEYDRSFAQFRAAYPNKSDSEVHLELERSRVRSQMDRRQGIYTKMSRFYNSNRFKSTQF